MHVRVMSCAQRQTANNEGVSCESFGGRKQCGGCIPNSSWTFDRKLLAGRQCSLSVDYSRLCSGYLEVAFLELDAPCMQMPGERRERGTGRRDNTRHGAVTYLRGRSSRGRGGGWRGWSPGAVTRVSLETGRERTTARTDVCTIRSSPAGK